MIILLTYPLCVIPPNLNKVKIQPGRVHTSLFPQEE